jgi:hypothetical protein
MQELSLTEQQARQALVELVKHVLHQEDGVLKKLTYEELAERINRLNKNGDPAARGMGHHVLGCMGRMLRELGEKIGVPIPHLQATVVQKTGPDRDLPDVGISAFIPGWKEWGRSQKEASLHVKYDEILQFGEAWNEVLRELNLPPVSFVTGVSPDVRSTPYGHSGGESAAHKALKKHLVQNPQILGLDSTWNAFEEWALPSGDKIDLLFQSPNAWVGVEVKSIVSDRDIYDYQRGIYQAVKYLAVLRAIGKAEAGQKEQLLPKTGSVRVLLVLQGRMPEEFKHIAIANRVEYLEQVNPT